MVRFIYVLLLALIFNVSLVEANGCRIVINDKNLKLALTEYLKQERGTETIIIRAIINNNHLLLVEYESKDFEPVIELIVRNEKGFKTVDDWGGAVIESQEGTTKQVVLNYFKSNHPEINIDGLSCYEPVGPPFRH